jgi:hypothetical protein
MQNNISSIPYVLGTDQILVSSKIAFKSANVQHLATISESTGANVENSVTTSRAPGPGPEQFITIAITIGLIVVLRCWLVK